MYEYRFAPAEPRSWPTPPRRGPDPVAERTADIAELVSVAGDTRRLGYTTAGLLAAVLVGTAAVGSALALRGHALALGSAVILLPVLACWLVSAALVLMAEGPLSTTWGELRHVTGAAVDPSAPWRPVGVDPLADSAVTWDLVVPLIGAATRQHARARVALSAAVLTTAGFMAWMALSVAAVTLA